MDLKEFFIHSDITKAHTLPADLYRNPEIFNLIKEKIFARTWHCIGLQSDVSGAGSVQPFSLMEGYLDEPLVLTRDESNTLHCLSNVCTHRGNILVEEGGTCHELKCRYHGRRFDLNGKFKSMPEFREAADFPSEADHLPGLPLHTFGELLFTAINPAYSFEKWIQPVKERVGWLPVEEFFHSPEHSRTYTVQANWALYVDNYLEGFHIPFVHPGLNERLKYSEYSYEIYPWSNLQLGIAKEGEMTFNIPINHKDFGKKIHAWYFWLFPNIMLNFYPWGLSLNLIQPISQFETQIRFETFIWKEDLFDYASQDLIHLTEMEDEAIVEMVQRGVRSRLYNKGRFSPRMEIGVHHFHKLISEVLTSKAVHA
ncbi:MAG: aromatic ring-hydroxylating dioxygenase subunit alpha [Bacteroidia bacterium]